MKNAILVTGGAGYIGSHTAKRLLDQGRNVVILDNLSTGHKEVVTLFNTVYGSRQFAFENVDLLDRNKVEKVFKTHELNGIVDFAAKAVVPESQENPQLYFDNNVIAFRNLVLPAASRGIPIVKSSTAATYGDPTKFADDPDKISLTEKYQSELIKSGKITESQLMPAKFGFETFLQWYADKITRDDNRLALDETDVKHLMIPTNWYGVTKVADERIAAHLEKHGLRSAFLRYFNACGADTSKLIGEDHKPESHLIPLILQVPLGQREHIKIFGTDYPTTDGTCIRDYISVPTDLTDAHTLALDYLLKGGKSRTWNLGTGNGYSVTEIIETARKVTGQKIRAEGAPRRSGDPAVLIADSSRIKQDLGWEAKEPLEDTIRSAWDWHRLNPNGFGIAQETRYSPFWGRKVFIAAHRGSRPWSGELQDLREAEQKDFDPNCYLCPGNKRVGGGVNPDYKGPWTFKNDHATLAMPARPDTTSGAGGNMPNTSAVHGPYRASSSKGICEVIVYGPNHSLRLSTMDVSVIKSVVDEWVKIYKRLGSEPEIKYVLIFENRGDIMGNSQLHPHGQVYAYSTIPDLMLIPQLKVFVDYKKQTGNCFVCDAIEFEKEDSRRVVAQNGSFIAFVPYAAMLPNDVIVVPFAHIQDITAFDDAQKQDMAAILKQVLSGLDGLFAVPYHYSMALIQAPTDGKNHDDFHMQIHITSLLRGPGLRKHIVGADIFGGIINPSDPNHQAEAIRYAMKRGNS